jgi:hypothetical protein
MRGLRVLGLAGLLFALGCSGSGLAEVSGTVLMDDQPLKEGEIIFEEKDQSKTPAAGKISEGKYKLEVTPGSKIVKILASRPTAKPDPVMGSAAREAALGTEFNEKSTLTYTVTSGRNEGVDFKVKELPKGKK